MTKAQSKLKQALGERLALSARDRLLAEADRLAAEFRAWISEARAEIAGTDDPRRAGIGQTDALERAASAIEEARRAHSLELLARRLSDLTEAHAALALLGPFCEERSLGFSAGLAGEEREDFWLGARKTAYDNGHRVGRRIFERRQGRDAEALGRSDVADQ